MVKVARHDDYAYDVVYEASEEQKHNRAQRNKARRAALREGKVHKGDSFDIHHTKGISGPTKILPRSKNRSIK